MGPAPLGGSVGRGKVSGHWEVPSLVGRSAGTEGERQSHGGEHNHQCAEGKAERDLPRWSVPPSIHQPETLVHWGRRGLGAEAQASEVRPWGEDCGWLCGDSLTGLGCRAPRPREYGKKPGTAGIWEETWDCQRGKVPLLGVCARRGSGLPQELPSLSTHSQATGHCLHELQGRVQAAAAISDSRGRCRPLLLLRVPRPRANRCPLLPGSVHKPRTCTP